MEKILPKTNLEIKYILLFIKGIFEAKFVQIPQGNTRNGRQKSSSRTMFMFRVIKFFLVNLIFILSVKIRIRTIGKDMFYYLKH